MPIKLNGSSSGYTQIEAAATAGDNTLTLPTTSGTLMTTGGTNTFTANQVIEVTDNTNAALRITQLGTGAALLVEDSTNPDSTPFIVDASGNVGIGTAGPQSTFMVSSPSGSAPINTSGNGVARLESTQTAAVGVGPSLVFQGRTGNSTATYGFAAIQGFKSSATAGDYSGSLAFFTQNSGGGTALTEQMRIDASGNVGIGLSSPASRLDIKTTSANSNDIRLSYSSTDYLGFSGQSDGYQIGAIGSAVLRFATGGTERMRIDSNGKVLVGTSSTFIGASNLQIASSLNEQIAIRSTAAAAGRCWRFTADNNNTTYIINQDTVGVYIGNGGTSWSGLSDERAKDIIEPISDAASKVSTLRAVIGKYKTDEEGKRRSFLIAQDVQAVLPEAISVADQETGYLGLSYTDTIPLLTAALQEALTKIDALEARLAALENA